ncbi:MAG TPA: radical SAM protein [Syntrophorhabdaceae bacterium]|nr:radical SAM protein [Syntrophorhabdaceae bacterium]HPU28727.1 radical SAM protein [Syntrophorhabdaceae bacterium]
MVKREFNLRMIAWELTRNCNLNCIHCRARASLGPHTDELTTEECINIIEDVSTFANPTIIITGGEPLLRKDVFEIAEYGSKKGLRFVMAINGTLLDREKAYMCKKVGIKRISISIDGKDKDKHDMFRGVNGAFDGAVNAAGILKEIGLPFQINTTVTLENVYELNEIYSLTKRLGACAWHVFMLVPVGRAENFKGRELDAKSYEATLEQLYEIESKKELEIKVTCAPHYYRIVKEKGGIPESSGCLAGKSFMFISHRGIAQPCGYLEVPSGDVRKEGVREVWLHSRIFNMLRDFTKYKGKCGKCKYISICGGCRARSYETTGDFLEEEPYCFYKI